MDPNVDDKKPETTDPTPEPDQAQMVLDTLLEEGKGTEVGPLEPEIKVEGGETSPPSPAVATDDLSRALATIEELKAKVDKLESRPQPSAVESRPEALRAEPEIEMVEYFPGTPIAKDANKRAIRVTDDDLIRAGWNESPAHAIEVMANTFYNIIERTIPQLTEGRMRAQTKAVEEGQTRRSRFDELFPDLKGYDDLMEIVERNERRDGGEKRVISGPDDYLKIIGEAGRKRVAQLRGMSFEQYMASVNSKTVEPVVTTGSRQRTSPQAGRSGPTPKLSEQQELIADTLKDT